MKERSVGRGGWHISMAWFVVFSIVLLAAGVSFGYEFPSHFGAILQPALDKVHHLADQLQGKAAWHLALAILVNNVVVAVTLILLGIVFGIYPAWTMWMNGVVIGIVCSLVMKKAHASLASVLVYAILPHGIFEIAALVWASAIGFQLGFALLASISRRFSRRDPVPVRGGLMSFRIELARALRHFPAIVGLLVIAACIEAYITPGLISSHFGL